MAGRYSKNFSTYRHKKYHQMTKDGIIYEQDWNTLGERHVIETGKERVYSSSGFLFTDNTIRTIKQRNNTGVWSDAYTLSELSPTINKSVNHIQLSESYDLRDYAYWGSASELIRTSIENIIKSFPARIWSENDTINLYNSLYNEYYTVVSITDNGDHDYTVNYSNGDNDGECEIYFEAINIGEENDDCVIGFSDNTNNKKTTSYLYKLNNPFKINISEDNIIVKKYDNKYRTLSNTWFDYTINGETITSYTTWIRPYEDCVPDNTVIYHTILTYGNNTLNIYGFQLFGNIVWCCDLDNCVIQPKTEIIDNYFNTLDGFERVLLTKRTTPLYSPELLTPYQDEYLFVDYVPETYTWPSTDYCIDINSIGYELYLERLYALGRAFDEYDCDNLWNNMTHESIKNFDWVYNVNESEFDEDELVRGGQRMESVIHFMGLHFDDLKRWVTNIGNKNHISYDNENNIASAELSDKAQLLGWEVYSTKTNNTDNIYLTNNIKWYPKLNPTQVCQNDVDNNFMRKLALNSNAIFTRKGTKEAIEMVMGLFGICNNEEDKEYEFKEFHYLVENPIPYDQIFPFYEIRYDEEYITESELTQYVDKGVTLEEYLLANNGILNVDEAPKYLRCQVGLDENEEPEYNYYDLNTDYTFGEFIKLVNSKKENYGMYLYYNNDMFSGLPFQLEIHNNVDYIVPGFTQEQIYDGDVQFETNGGWGKYIKKNDSTNLDDYTHKNYDYLETLPYIEVVKNCDGLLNINPYHIDEKRIFYVIDISDITKLTETVPTHLSHYFKLNNFYAPNLPSSWQTIPMLDEPEDIYNDICSNSDEYDTITYDDYKEACYHDKLKSYNLANNPHVGYAKYDLGNEYYQYCVNPFKYIIDNVNIINDYNIYTAIKYFQYTISLQEDNTRIVNLTQETNDKPYQYYLPTKKFVFKNNIDNDLYIKYFNEVILKYVLQVIPSTTILVLENCLPKPKNCTVSYYYVDTLNDTVKPKEIITVPINTPLVIEPKDISCYEPIGWKYHNTNEIFTDYNIDEVTEDISVDVIYKSIKRNVNIITIDENSEVLTNNDIKITHESDNCGITGIITIINNSKCYEYNGLFLNGEFITNEFKYEYDVTNYSDIDIIYEARFTKNQLQVTLVKPSNVSTLDMSVYVNNVLVDNDNITNEYNVPINCGDKVRFELKDIDNYILNNWKVINGDDTYVSTDKNYCEINPVYEDYRIEPIYDRIKQYVSLTIEKPDNIDNCEVTVSINSGVSTSYILPQTINNITDEDTVQVRIVNNSITNYVFDNWDYNTDESDINVTTSNNNTIITISNISEYYIIKPIYKRKYKLTIEKPDNIDDCEIKYRQSIGSGVWLVTTLTTNQEIEIFEGQPVEVKVKDITIGDYTYQTWEKYGSNANINGDTITINSMDNDYTIKPIYGRSQYTVTTTIYYPGVDQGYQVGQGLVGGNIDFNNFEKSTNYTTGSNIQIVANDITSTLFEGWFKEVNGGWQFLSVKNPYIINNLQEDIKIGGSFGITDCRTSVIVEKNGTELDKYYENSPTTPVSDKFNFTVGHIKTDTDSIGDVVSYYSEYDELNYNSDPGNRYFIDYREYSQVPLCFKIQSIRPINNINDLPTIVCKYRTSDGGHDAGDFDVTNLFISSWELIPNTNNLYECYLQITMTSISSPSVGIVINFQTN